MLPIECSDLDAALTIFGTLNDRGMALADSDIFKAELYKQQHTKDEKESFARSGKTSKRLFPMAVFPSMTFSDTTHT